MAKEKTATRTSFLQDLFQFGVYKRNQGRVVRQVTFAALAVSLLLGAWKLFDMLVANRSGDWYLFSGIEYVLPGVLLLVGAWFAYRLVNYPQFADFLISVEAEMNKVSWPSRTELIRSSLVVIFLMFFLAFVLFGFDLTWQILFKALGVIQTRGTSEPPPVEY
jgi:preprotein translocase subunit SecE